MGDKDSDVAAGRAAGVAFNIKLVHEPPAESAADRLEVATLQAVGDWLARALAGSVAR